MSRRILGFTLRAMPLLLLCPGLFAATDDAADEDSPSVRGRVVMTNEHGQTLYQDMPGYEFQFSRLIYTENPEFSRGWSLRWTTDSPAAETHLAQGIARLTRVRTAPRGTAVSLEESSLFDHPLIYAVEVGGWDLSDAEAARLREYLNRGGTLIVDDFHGSREWAGFMASMSRVFPDRPVEEIPDADPVFHLVFDLSERPQIPGMAALMRGVTYEQDGYTPHWRGIYDDHGRLCVIINFNMDMGDAWENADNPFYPQPLTGKAYRFAVNYVLYAMSR